MLGARAVAARSPPGHRPNQALAVERVLSKIEAARSKAAERSPPGRRPVAAGRSVSHWAASSKSSATFDLATLIFDLNRSTANARLGRYPGGKRPGTERILAPRQTPAGYRAISLKLARWPVGDRSGIGRVTVRSSPPGEALRFRPVVTLKLTGDRREIDRVPPSAQASLGLYSLPNFSPPKKKKSLGDA